MVLLYRVIPDLMEILFCYFVTVVVRVPIAEARFRWFFDWVSTQYSLYCLLTHRGSGGSLIGLILGTHHITYLLIQVPAVH